jgi:hypothetical protein
MNFITDPKTGCLVYGTLNKPGSTDPEVDSAYFTCYYYYFLILKSTDSITKLNLCRAFSRTKDNFIHSDGVFRRYSSEGLNKADAPEEAKFNNPLNLSRDNTTPIIISMGHFGYYQEIQDFMLQTLKRGSFFQNKYTHKGVKKFMPDLATPDNWATFIRAWYEAKNRLVGTFWFTKLFIYLLLNVLDIFSIFQTGLHVLHTRFISSNDTGSELNFFASCVQRKLVMPTVLGLVANYIYFNCRAFPSEVSYNGEYSSKAWIAAVENFFGRGRRYKIVPELDVLVRKLDEKYKF